MSFEPKAGACLSQGFLYAVYELCVASNQYPIYRDLQGQGIGLAQHLQELPAAKNHRLNDTCRITPSHVWRVSKKWVRGAGEDDAHISIAVTVEIPAGKRAKKDHCCRMDFCLGTLDKISQGIPMSVPC